MNVNARAPTTAVTGAERARQHHRERHDDADLEPHGERRLEQAPHRLAVIRERSRCAIVATVNASTIDAEHHEHPQPRADDVLPAAHVTRDHVEDGAPLDLDRDPRRRERQRHDERRRVHERDGDLAEHRRGDADAVARQRGNRERKKRREHQRRPRRPCGGSRRRRPPARWRAPCSSAITRPSRLRAPASDALVEHAREVVLERVPLRARPRRASSRRRRARRRRARTCSSATENTLRRPCTATSSHSCATAGGQLALAARRRPTSGRRR